MLVEIIRLLAYIWVGLWILLSIQLFRFSDDPEYIVTNNPVYKVWVINILSGILISSLICSQFVDKGTVVIISIFFGFWWFMLSTFGEIMISVWLEDVDW